MRDWQSVAQEFYALAFDFDAEGDYLPLIWWDNGQVNIPGATFGLPSYVGGSPNRDGHHEGITCLAALLGATVAGIDKSQEPHNFIEMAEAYHNSRNGQNLVLNSVNTTTGNSFWYELYPHYLFYGLVDSYPGIGNLERIMRTTAQLWYNMCVTLGGPEGRIDFYHTSFDFEKMKPVDNGRWYEPDAAGAIALLQYFAYMKFREPEFLQAADWCLTWLEQQKDNPHYEALMPMGALAAARLNAEQGCLYDIGKMVNWCFNPSDTRLGWGVIAERWGDYDCHGLVGSITDGSGYAFTMNTFEHSALLVPLARYDKRFARAIGKWMLNAANAARLFYPNAHPPERQTFPDWGGDPRAVIAYEGLRKEGLEYARRTPRLKDLCDKEGNLPPELEQEWKGRQPFALGDPSQYGWNAPTDFGLYGSVCVGFYGGIVSHTDVKGILQLDLLATDFFRSSAYPTFLLYNPYPETKEVSIDLGKKPRDIYEAINSHFLAQDVSGITKIAIPSDSATIIVLAPAGGRVTRNDRQLLVDGAIVDFDVSNNTIGLIEK
jgi:hypothetical protein